MVKIRTRCSHCGNIIDVNGQNDMCNHCNNVVTLCEDGGIEVFREGRFSGSMNAMGLYINGQPFGLIGNGESVRIPLPYGTYNIHCTLGMIRRCDDLQVAIAPENRYACITAKIKTGFWVSKIVL